MALKPVIHNRHYFVDKYFYVVSVQLATNNQPLYLAFQLMTAIVGKLELSSEPLPQDLAEGVEEDEWVCDV